MKLYEIDSAIEDLLDRETGEISDVEAFEALHVKRDELLENTACCAKNLASDIKALAEEEKNLHDRRTVLERKRERLEKYLSFALDGEKFSTPRCDVRFRKSQALEITDERTLREWLELSAPSFLIAQDPKIDRAGIKDAVKGGAEIPCVELVTRQNIAIK